MSAVPDGLRDLFGRLRAYRVKNWGPDSAEMADDEDREVVVNLDEAHVVVSILDPQPPAGQVDDFLTLEPVVAGTGQRHALLLDIDFPAYLVESSTPGHCHLYIDVPGGIPDSAYWPLIQALAKAGVIESGYAGVSEDRGYTSLRLPWIHKLMEDEKAAKA